MESVSTHDGNGCRRGTRSFERDRPQGPTGMWADEDGSLLVTLTKHDDNHVYKLWVTGLYTPQEHVIREEIMEVKGNGRTT